MIDPGSLNQRVDLLAPTVSRGTNGEAINTWGAYGTRWAKVESLGGTEGVQTAIEMPSTRAKFTFRYNADYTENFRLVWNSQTWNVISISFVEERQFIEMLAETNTTQAGDSTIYADYYDKSSLRIRVVTASAVTTITPSQAQLTSDIGLTPASAGMGYICEIYIAALMRYLLVTSNGTYWFYSYVKT